MDKKRVFGFKPTVFDGTERIYDASISVELPDSYSYKGFLPTVIDQGEYSICVPCSVSAYLNWRENLKHGNIIDNKISLFEIYNSRPDNTDGMTFKDAFKYLKHTGVKSKVGRLKIKGYGRVVNAMALKCAIIANGPCVGALPVYSYDKKFWEQKSGEELMGYHAISIMGYDEEGFIIRNSWGTDFGNNGYTHISYDDYDTLFDIWTVLD